MTLYVSTNQTPITGGRRYKIIPISFYFYRKMPYNLVFVKE
jgi:hypothetical protein